MKKKLKKIILFTMVVVAVNFIRVPVEAQTSSTAAQVPLQVVDELDNHRYPKMTTVRYTSGSNINKSEFTLDSPGQLNAVIRENIFSAFRQREMESWRGPDSIEYQFGGYAWISADSSGNSIVGDIRRFADSKTEMTWFLEEGTYYLCTIYDRAAYSGDASFALLFERANIGGQKLGTSFANSRNVGFNEVANGFISDMRPNNYYAFYLNKEATVSINYSFDTSFAAEEDIGYCGLYDVNELLIEESTYIKGDRGLNSFNYLLEPGAYYIKMNGLRGNTLLSIDLMYYDIEITADSDVSWTDEGVDVYIDTIIDFTDISVVYGDVKKGLIDNEFIWSKESENYIQIDGEASFTAEENGVYSVRITDKYGHNTMEKIRVSNIDITKPEIEGVEDGMAYQNPVTITWTDEGSGIDVNKTRLNGKRVKSGVKVSKEGKYSLEVYDKVGNYETVEFYIDNTAPTVNVQNGRTYNGSVTLRFKDNVSGISKVAIDNVEVSSTRSMYHCYLDGEYTVELWDHADNYKKVVFNIRK